LPFSDIHIKQYDFRAFSMTKITVAIPAIIIIIGIIIRSGIAGAGGDP